MQFTLPISLHLLCPFDQPIVILLVFYKILMLKNEGVLSSVDLVKPVHIQLHGKQSTWRMKD